MSTITAHIGELKKFRALVGALVTRHLAVRYRGSLLGFLWTLLNPLALMVTYWLVFAVYIRFQEVDHYAVFLFCGLLPWIWLSSALIEGTTSIQTSGHLITKSMFPAHVLPLVANIATMINFLLSLPLLFAFLYFSVGTVPLTVLLLPFLIAINFVFIQGLVLMLSSINVMYRDVQHLVGSALTFLFFLCPILYPAEMVPEGFRFTLDLNPLAGFTTLYQSLLLEGAAGSLMLWGFLAAFALLSYLCGLLVFSKFHERFAELL